MSKIALARDADQFFIEAPFLDVDANIAAERWHLGHRSIMSTVRYTALTPSRFKNFWKD
jgi:hypothetical protein